MRATITTIATYQNGVAIRAVFVIVPLKLFRVAWCQR
jgi:hypothetical protein